MREGIWSPGCLHVAGSWAETEDHEPLSTWWPIFDQTITDWKQERVYVDARDVTPASFPFHPSKLLGAEHPRLRSLLAITPVFALGSAEVAASIAGARTYRVGFVRTADDAFSAHAQGQGLDRSLRAPFHALEEALGTTPGHIDREVLVDRVLARMTDGRLTRRSLDLAETWSALVGGPSMFTFDETERREYLDVLEAALDEAFARSAPMLREHEAIARAMRGGAPRVELPGLGAAEHTVLPEVILRGERDRPRDTFGIEIGFDGATEIVLPATRTYRLSEPVPSFEPAPLRAWRMRAPERLARARASHEARAGKKSSRTRLALWIVVALAVLGSPCVYFASKSAPGGPCKTKSDCRAGYCRKAGRDVGTCTLLCSPDGRCSGGRECRFDPERNAHACLVPEP